MPRTKTTASDSDKTDQKAPSKRRTIKTPLPRKPSMGSSHPLLDPSTPVTLFDKHSLAWMMTMIHLHGSIRHDPRQSFYLPWINVGGKPEGPFIELRRLSPAMQQGLATQCKEEILKRFERLAKPSSFPREAPRMEWKVAFGSRKSLDDQASFHVETIDYDQMKIFHNPMMILAITICNLRNYYDQDKASTIDLIQKRYNRRYGVKWSEDDIALIWNLVDGYTPSMWLCDSRHKTEKRDAAIQCSVQDVLYRLTPGGRILVQDLLKLVNECDPDLKVTKRKLGDAVRALTGNASKASNGASYYFGFQLPYREDPPYDGAAPSSIPMEHVHQKVPTSNLIII